MAKREQGTSSYSDETKDSQPRSEPKVVDGTMLKPKRGRPFKMNDLRYLPGFFKIYLPEYNSKELVIPRDFVRNFSGKIDKNVNLRNLQGKTWKMDYNGNATFTVEIFGVNGCKKEEATATNGQPHVDARGTKTKSQVTTNVRRRTIPLNNIRFRRVYEGCLYDLFIPAGIFKTYNIVAPKPNHSGTILLRNQRGYSLEVKFWKRVDRFALSHGWREFQINSDIDKGDECEFEVILGEGRKIKEIILLQVRPTNSS
uniref:TF-B3 domain-containing protein n=1 Tax=Chenopodium quinoa TaxID=63459 RepID=A0A803KP30_CHEQI